MLLIRNSLACASWKDRKLLAAELRPAYTAASAERQQNRRSTTSSAARVGSATPGSQRPGAGPWGRVVPFFAFRPEVRRIVYTSNAIESVHSRLSKIIQTGGHFTSEDAAASKLIWLAMRNTTADWSRAAKKRKLPVNHFAILFGERLTETAHGAGR